MLTFFTVYLSLCLIYICNKGPAAVTLETSNVDTNILTLCKSTHSIEKMHKHTCTHAHTHTHICKHISSSAQIFPKPEIYSPNFTLKLSPLWKLTYD